MKIPKICQFTSSVALSGLYYFFERQMVLHVYLKKKKGHNFNFFFCQGKTLKWRKLKMLVFVTLVFCTLIKRCLQLQRQSLFLGPRGAELDMVLVVCGQKSFECWGRWLGGGTAPDALPKLSPAEAGGRRREGEKEKNIAHHQHTGNC